MEESKPLNTALGALPEYWAQLGIPEPGAVLLEYVQAGFAFAFLGHLAEVSGFSPRELAAMAGLTGYALRQGRKLGRFSTTQSDQLYRIARVVAAAQVLFEGDCVSARAWFTSAQWGIGGRRPVDLLATEIGAGVVCDLLGRIEYGVLP
jgi:putative toxin-antitoxin system antitoxin component (TIGR02293 family)